MANKLFNQLNEKSLANNNILGMLAGSRNPQQLLTNLINTNPQVRNIMNEINNNGGNAKDLFYKKAKEMGVDPNTILSQLKNFR